ncbi:MAG: glycosyltransferase, partial [Polyangiales bacterium]
MNGPELSVILFAFNEEANIAPVLLELREWLSIHEPSAEIVFVDDGSTDGTSAEASKALAGSPHQLVRHETNRGIGAALKTGVQTA